MFSELDDQLKNGILTTNTLDVYYDQKDQWGLPYLNKKQYDAYVADLVNFMVYIAEPVQMERRNLGVYVLIFLFFFAVLAYMLKKEYWKDVH